MRPALLALLATLPVVGLTPAAGAQTAAHDEAEFNLEPDDEPDLWTLVPGADGYAALDVGALVSPSGPAQRYVVPRMAWADPTAGAPRFRLNPNGALQIVSRDPTLADAELQLTLAYRNDQAVVAGWTYFWPVPARPGVTGMCDANLLTGEATVSFDYGPAEPVAIARGAVPLVDWDAAAFRLPSPCGD